MYVTPIVAKATQTRANGTGAFWRFDQLDAADDADAIARVYLRRNGGTGPGKRVSILVVADGGRLAAALASQPAELAEAMYAAATAPERSLRAVS